MLRAIALAALALFVTAASAEAQWEEQVRRLITRDAAALASEGFTLTRDIITGSLDDDERGTHTINLREDEEYVIVGECDEDCSDLDLFLYDENDNLIDSDVEMDDYPIVRVTPAWTGRFRVRVSMATCSTEPCWYGLGVLSR